MSATHPALSATFVDKTGARRKDLAVRRLIIAGWTGRDVAAMTAHIEELAELGVPRPARTPIFYRVAAARLTMADAIQVSGPHSSGEAEFVLAKVDGVLWVGVGSDHTDRQAETHGIALSKQVCDKPIAATFWPFDEVKDHWDALQLVSRIVEDGEDRIYQEGSVAAMRPPEQLLALFAEEDDLGGLQDGDVMMGGTLAAIGGIRPSGHFGFELRDPTLGRAISHAYAVEELPVAG